MSNIRIMYLRDNKIQRNEAGKGRGNPVGCVAIRLVEGKCYYAVTSLNPADKFDRDLGRQLTKGRLVEDPHVVLMREGPAKMVQVTKIVMEHIIQNKSLPQRIRRAAILWQDGK